MYELENILKLIQTYNYKDIKCLTMAYLLFNMLYKQAILSSPIILKK